MTQVAATGETGRDGSVALGSSGVQVCKKLAAAATMRTLTSRRPQRRA
jgi:hypothetical protein